MLLLVLRSQRLELQRVLQRHRRRGSQLQLLQSQLVLRLALLRGLLQLLGRVPQLPYQRNR